MINLSYRLYIYILDPLHMREAKILTPPVYIVYIVYKLATQSIYGTLLSVIGFQGAAS